MKKEFWIKFEWFMENMKARFKEKENEYFNTWETLPLSNLELLLLEQCYSMKNFIDPEIKTVAKETQIKELADLANRALTVAIRLNNKEIEESIKETEYRMDRGYR